MNPESAFALLAAIRAHLLADAGVAAAVGPRIYDVAPLGVVFPYIQTGDIQSLPFEDGMCINGSELFITIHTWARGQTPAADMHRANAAVRFALHGQTFAVAGHTLQAMDFQTTRTLRDPDGITRHGVVDFRAFTTAA